MMMGGIPEFGERSAFCPLLMSGRCCFLPLRLWRCRCLLLLLSFFFFFFFIRGGVRWGDVIVIIVVIINCRR